MTLHVECRGEGYRYVEVGACHLQYNYVEVGACDVPSRPLEVYVENVVQT